MYSSVSLEVRFVSVVTKCPTICYGGRDRDVCFLREFAVFIHELRLLFQYPSDDPSVYDISDAMRTEPFKKATSNENKFNALFG